MDESKAPLVTGRAAVIPITLEVWVEVGARESEQRREPCLPGRVRSEAATGAGSGKGGLGCDSEEGALLENRQVASAMRMSAALGEPRRHKQVAVLSSFLAFVHLRLMLGTSLSYASTLSF